MLQLRKHLETSRNLEKATNHAVEASKTNADEALVQQR